MSLLIDRISALVSMSFTFRSHDLLCRKYTGGNATVYLLHYDLMNRIIKTIFTCNTLGLELIRRYLKLAKELMKPCNIPPLLPSRFSSLPNFDYQR